MWLRRKKLFRSKGNVVIKEFQLLGKNELFSLSYKIISIKQSAFMKMKFQKSSTMNINERANINYI